MKKTDITREHKRILREQEMAIMPLIGPLLDAWDDLPNDVKCDPEFDRIRNIIDKIDEAMEEGEMDKTKYHKGDVYRRTESGRYIPIGYQWEGFRADGIWLVQNGKCNMTCLIGLKEKVPIFALNYRQHQQGIVDRIQAREKEVGHGLSLYDMVIIACDYFAHVAAKQVEA